MNARLRLAVCEQDRSRPPGTLLRIPQHQRRPADRRPAWLPPTCTNVSIDSNTDAGHRARCGHRCGDEAATRDSENARPRYAYTGHSRLVTALLNEQVRRRPASRGSFWAKAVVVRGAGR
jgi:hypothetical protein